MGVFYIRSLILDPDPSSHVTVHLLHMSSHWQKEFASIPKEGKITYICHILYMVVV